MKQVLNIVRPKLRPSKQEINDLQNASKQIQQRIKKHLPKDVEIGLMGSVAKGTALKENRDLDMFLLFSDKYKPEEIKTKGILWAKKAMKGFETELNYAQHPYLKVWMPTVKVDIVPSFKIKNNEKLKTAVDRSQLHTVWVNKKITQEMQDDVRLLKQFLITLGVYGAQSRVEGFSGYLCELLIIKYRSFENLVESASKWSRPVIDIEGKIGEAQAKKMFEKASMIVIDPVDEHRNVSAVVSQTSLSRFIIACRQFCENPTNEFFFAKKRYYSKKEVLDAIKRRGTHIIIIEFEPPKLVEDILWPQLKKTTHTIISKIEHDEFRVFGHYFYCDSQDAFIMLELMDWKLPSVKRINGPNVSLEQHVGTFIKTHRFAENIHAEHDRIVALERRKNTQPLQSIKEAIENGKNGSIPRDFFVLLKKSRIQKPNWLAKSKKMREIACDYLFRKL